MLALNSNRIVSRRRDNHKILPRFQLIGPLPLLLSKEESEKGKLRRIKYLQEKLDENIIGSNSGFMGPFGWRKYTYCDHTASGKALKYIERFIEAQILPHYANTHTTVSYTSMQTSTFRMEARNIIKHCVGASDEDEVIFCGSGATACVHKLLHSISYPKSRKLIVLIGPFEHHSNMLPWREVASKFIQIPMNSTTGQVDISFLQKTLQELVHVKGKKKKEDQLVVGCFSAGSNITGAVTDDIEITELLHKFGALAFWDYAAAAPHVNIRMNPLSSKSNKFYESNESITLDGCAAFKDAIFFSGHKFLGGPQTPGVLVVKKHVMQNPLPHGMGGGTVLFTTKQHHKYLESIEEREEGGTPDIVGSIRLGLVFQLRNLFGEKTIVEIEAEISRKVLYEWSQVPEIHILGNNQNPRLPCFSFIIEHLASGYYLHHSFVVALLNDLFGIQCRGGCMCAGPYAQDLLGINEKLASYYEDALKDKRHVLGGVLKPGFTRLSFSYHSKDEEVNFVIEAVKLIARHGWKLLPFYKIDGETGTFVFNKNLANVFTSSVTSLYEFSTKIIFAQKEQEHKSLGRFTEEYLSHARRLFMFNNNTLYSIPQENCEISSTFKTNKHLKRLRWFLLPFESLYIQQYGDSVKSQRPFQPISFGISDSFDNAFSFPSSSHDSIPFQISCAWGEYDLESSLTHSLMETHWMESTYQIEVDELFGNLKNLRVN